MEDQMSLEQGTALSLNIPQPEQLQFSLTKLYCLKWDVSPVAHSQEAPLTKQTLLLVPFHLQARLLVSRLGWIWGLLPLTGMKHVLCPKTFPYTADKKPQTRPGGQELESPLSNCLEMAVNTTGRTGIWILSTWWVSAAKAPAVQCIWSEREHHLRKRYLSIHTR